MSFEAGKHMDSRSAQTYWSITSPKAEGAKKHVDVELFIARIWGGVKNQNMLFICKIALKLSDQALKKIVFQKVSNDDAGDSKVSYLGGHLTPHKMLVNIISNPQPTKCTVRLSGKRESEMDGVAAGGFTVKVHTTWQRCRMVRRNDLCHTCPLRRLLGW